VKGDLSPIEEIEIH